MEKLHCQSLVQSQAGDMLGISVRQVKGLVRALKTEGAKGLISKKRGGKSNHQLPEEIKKEAIGLILEK